MWWTKPMSNEASIACLAFSPGLEVKMPFCANDNCPRLVPADLAPKVPSCGFIQQNCPSHDPSLRRSNPWQVFICCILVFRGWVRADPGCFDPKSVQVDSCPDDPTNVVGFCGAWVVVGGLACQPDTLSGSALSVRGHGALRWSAMVAGGGGRPRRTDHLWWR